MANATSVLRMSGMNSGLDTEAIVNALTATTKNKINTNQRKVLKLQAQQEAYRSLITSFTNFQNKYFTMSSVNTCLKSGSLFNSFKGTLSNAAGTNVNGVTVSSSSGANPATYDVEVHTVATQSTLKSATASGKPTDLSQCVDPNQDYSMTVSVGSKTKTITFKGGSTDGDRRTNVNDALKSAFGIKNDGSGIVTIDSEGRISSSDQAAVVTTVPTIYTDKRELSVDVNNMQTGNNTFTVTVGNEVKKVNISTISADYFDDIFDDSGIKDGNHIKEDADATKVALFKEVAANDRGGLVYDAFKDYEKAMTDDHKADFAKLYTEAKRQSEIDSATETIHNNAKSSMTDSAYKHFKENFEFRDDGMNYIEQGVTIEEWNAFQELESEYTDMVNSGDIQNDDPEGENYLTLQSYVEENYNEKYKSLISEDDLNNYLENDDAGQLFAKSLDSELERIDKVYADQTQAALKTAQQALYDKAFEEAKQDAFTAAGEPGDIKDFKFTKEEFEATSYFTQYEADAEQLKNEYEQEGFFTVSYDSIKESDKIDYYDKNIYTGYVGDSEEDYLAGFTAEDAVRSFNTANIENNLGALSFKDELVNIKATVNDDGTVTLMGEGQLSGQPRQFSITQGANNVTDFGLDKASTSASGGIASQISTAQTLDELGLTADSNGNYNFSINGVDFSFSGDTTIKDMMKKVNASEAGVKMNYTTLTNQFVITSNEYGRGQKIKISDGGEGLLNALGFNGGEKFTEGQNTSIKVNGVEVETTSNSYTVDGTTFTFTKAAEGTSFTNDVKRDYSKAISAIKSFVEDYNKLIDEVYGYVDDEPNKDYYFLTDDDIDEMDLSESQQEKWEKLAKKGILYRDSSLSNIMTKLRSAMYSSVEAPDGKNIGLYSLGITTSGNTKDHGKLTFDPTVTDEMLEEKFAKYADEFSKLFNDTTKVNGVEKGLAYQLDNIINSAVKTTGEAGERGILVDKAGVSGTSSATNNSIYSQIRSLKDTIDRLQERYEQQQDRYWKLYSNMETSLGNINGQSSYIQQIMGSM